VDFVDVGLGTVRFYTFNVADSAISLAILLLLGAALVPSLIDGRRGHATAPEGTEEPLSEAESDAAFWADEGHRRDETGS
jgi:hypothetical protein